MYFYRLMAGLKVIDYFGGDDRYARKVLARWISLFWERYRSQYPGSIRYAANNGWYGSEVVGTIARVWCDVSGVVPCKFMTIIERFDMSERAEFIRAYR